MTDRSAAPPATQAAAAWLSEPVALSALGRGHINDTWLVTSPGGRFVLQRLNAAVFPDPRQVAAKVARVVDHLARDGRVAVPALLATRSGDAWHEDAAGVVWRLWRFADGTRTLEQLTTVEQGRVAGAAFGTFQLAIADLPGEVAEPMPGFLRLGRYLAELDAAAREEVGGTVQPTLRIVDGHRDLAELFRHADRLIHGDCKINNLLFRADRDEVADVIDLDTVMMGHWAWDFGDLARSAAATGERVDVARFAAIAAGFRRSGALDADDARDVLDGLLLAPRHVALMLGVRFLTDHLRGDRYFKVAYRGENLDRARRQLALVVDLERQERAMAAAVRRIA